MTLHFIVERRMKVDKKGRVLIPQFIRLAFNTDRFNLVESDDFGRKIIVIKPQYGEE